MGGAAFRPGGGRGYRRGAWRCFRSAAGPPNLRYLERLLAESPEQSDGRQSQRGDEICRDPQAGESGMGAGRGPWNGRRRGRSPHQGEGRPGPDRLGQLDADTVAAGTRACG